MGKIGRVEEEKDELRGGITRAGGEQGERERAREEKSASARGKAAECVHKQVDKCWLHCRCGVSRCWVFPSPGGKFLLLRRTSVKSG